MQSFIVLASLVSELAGGGGGGGVRMTLSPKRYKNHLKGEFRDGGNFSSK